MPTANFNHIEPSDVADIWWHYGKRATKRRINRRKRKPSLRSVMAQAARAGVPIAACTVNADGSITITPGAPDSNCASTHNLPPTISSEWN